MRGESRSLKGHTYEAQKKVSNRTFHVTDPRPPRPGLTEVTIIVVRLWSVQGVKWIPPSFDIKVPVMWLISQVNKVFAPWKRKR